MGAIRTKEKNHGIEEEIDQETQEGQENTADEDSGEDGLGLKRAAVLYERAAS
jgi:hypothetical protein